MRSIVQILSSILLPIIFVSGDIFDKHWISEKQDGYNLHFCSPDAPSKVEYVNIIENGRTTVNQFFGAPYARSFDIYIHPNRNSLDSTWQKDWQVPDFKSECWMVASGVASKLDMISPIRWDTDACEHHYADKIATRRLVTHELVHVYHGQLNISPDFSEIEGIDWFVEGLATYASGQCDSSRLSEIKNAIVENKVPDSLDKFWTGKLKYGLSGSMVMFIDKRYGRGKLTSLLRIGKKAEMLAALKTTESDLLTEWKNHFGR